MVELKTISLMIQLVDALHKVFASPVLHNEVVYHDAKCANHDYLTFKDAVLDKMVVIRFYFYEEETFKP